ncbi:spore coat protein U domain-containing protein [Hydrogenophaga sp.]|uniref:spore coat protein U domain-containing protein n=1 Tax=Hydrogenophaga sp. TaxID=1904254 RepID=UPI0035AF4B90
MNSHRLLAVVATCAAAFTPPAQTASVSATFSVQVTLYSSCIFNTGAGNVTVDYTAFQSTAASVSTTMQVQCTSGLPYQVSFSSTDANQRTASGNLNGLSYTISTPAPPTGGHKGTGASVGHTIDVSIPAGQSGSCASASCQASQAHTIYVVY